MACDKSLNSVDVNEENLQETFIIKVGPKLKRHSHYFPIQISCKNRANKVRMSYNKNMSTAANEGQITSQNCVRDFCDFESGSQDKKSTCFANKYYFCRRNQFPAIQFRFWME